MYYKVLIVDDAGVMLRNLKQLIDDVCDVRLAVSGAIALSSIKNDKPDIIFLDYDMPVMNGEETFDAIRNLENGKDIPIVFLTGADDKTTIMRLMRKKPDGYLLKPPAKEKIISVIEKIMSEREEK